MFPHLKGQTQKNSYDDMAKGGRTHIGTSGWHYRHWVGPFYPETCRPEEMLPFYARHFHTVEVNHSFYKLPEEEMLRSWVETVPEDFIFTVKASRYLTHMKKLKDPEEPLERLYRCLEPLGDKLGPILFQLPGRWRFDEERLRGFLSILSSDYRHAFEFRDERWINERSLERLAACNAAFCIYDFAGFASPRAVTADYAYVRLHGPGDKYRGSYDEHALAGWAGTFAEWTSKGLDVYCYFDNDEAAYAAQNAMVLQGMNVERDA